MIRTVRLTLDRNWGDPSSNTEKVMLKVVPTGAEAVDRPQGANPTATNM
jgi:hypothetical protein